MDLTAVGSVIASGRGSNGNENEIYAFDGNNSTQWNSGGTGSTTGDWIGKNFGAIYIVQTFYMTQLLNNWWVSSVKLQYAIDGISWVDIQTASSDSSGVISCNVNSYPGGAYFRALANAASTWTWIVPTITLTGVAGAVAGENGRRRTVL